MRKEGLDISLSFVGPGDPEILESLRKQIDSLDLSDHVFFLGPIFGAEKHTALSQHTMLLLPTEQENFGIVQYEALACGTPVVTTDGVETWESLEQSKAVVVVHNFENLEDRDRVIILANSCQQVLNNWDAMSTAARPWIEKNFDRKHLAANFSKIYEHACS